MSTNPYTNERTGRTEWLTPAEANGRTELRRQSHRTRTYSAVIPALHVTNGMRLRLPTGYRTVTAAHYAGDINGNGTTTLEYVGGEWVGPASTPVLVEHDSAMQVIR